MDIIEEKKELRREIRQRKAAMSEEGREAASARILAALEELPAFRDAGIVLAYSSLPDEVGTQELLKRWGERKVIVLPVVVGERLELKKYDGVHLKAGYRGIMEPSEEAVAVNPADIELAIVPGMAFDDAGRRLGRGGGYYDRLLPLLGCPKLGVCFECQRVERVPVEECDIIVDSVLSER